MFSKDELDAQADAAMQRRVAAGISDTVENLNDKVAPAFDQKLVGKQLEVCWKYFHKDTKEPMLIWATGRVVRVADGLTDTRSSRAQKVLPAASMQPYFALQPLFACGWTWAFLAEPIAPTMLSGGALMLAGALVASTDSRTVEDLQ